MVTTFCLRLALGMIAPMIILPAAIVPPRFFRVQFLSALALTLIAALFLPKTHAIVWTLLAISIVALVSGSIVWHTEEAPYGRTLIYVAAFGLFFLLALSRMGAAVDNLSNLTPEFLNDNIVRFVDDLGSSLLLGAAISAMLMGHSYLIAPAMSLSPLNRMLGLLAVALAARIGFAAWGLYEWTRLSRRELFSSEMRLLLGARWPLGLLIPVVLTWMAWESARIRSTQSATGILYVVTVVVFLGELLSMLLVEKTGFPM